MVKLKIKGIKSEEYEEGVIKELLVKKEKSMNLRIILFMKDLGFTSKDLWEFDQGFENNAGSYFYYLKKQKIRVHINMIWETVLFLLDIPKLYHKELIKHIENHFVFEVK